MTLTHFPVLQLRKGLVLAALLGGVAQGAAAATLDLAFPAPAENTASRVETMTSFRLPIGPFQQGTMTTALAEGPLLQNAFRIASSDLTTLQLMQPLRDQIATAGFSVIFECETQACGGFDFRYGTDVLPEPDMHVDLGDFRYLAAERPGPKGKDYISLLVSRSPQDGFVQMTRVGQTALPEPTLMASTKSPHQMAAEQTPSLPVQPEVPATGMAAALEQGGVAVLEDLVFASGSATLATGDYASLQELAAWLRANPDRTIALVGHTDASGGRAGNLSLSEKRAESVRQTLIKGFDIPAERVIADGVGYLAPRDSNQTEAGRQRNRRVEVMITSTQ